MQLVASTWWERINVSPLWEGADFLKWKSLVCCTIQDFSFCCQLQIHKLKCSDMGVGGVTRKGLSLKLRPEWRKMGAIPWSGGRAFHIQKWQVQSLRWPWELGVRKKAWSTSQRRSHCAMHGPETLISFPLCYYSALYPPHKPLLCPDIPSNIPVILQPQDHSLALLSPWNAFPFIFAWPILSFLQVFAQFSPLNKAYPDYSI